jgi:hypothetical protein
MSRDVRLRVRVLLTTKLRVRGEGVAREVRLCSGVIC